MQSTEQTSKSQNDVRCFAPGCMHKEGIQKCVFHPFPTDPSLRQLWIEKSRRKAPSDCDENSKLCGCHFLHSKLSSSIPQFFKYNRFGNVNLSVDQWPFAMLRHLTDMRNEKFMCDVTIVTHNEELQCHSLVLMAGSPVLQKMIRENSKKISGLRITTAFSSYSWRAVLNYFYTGKLEISPVYYSDCLELIEMLDIPYLKHVLGSNLGELYDSAFIPGSKNCTSKVALQVNEPSCGKGLSVELNRGEFGTKDTNLQTAVVVHKSSSYTVYESASDTGRQTEQDRKSPTNIENRAMTSNAEEIKRTGLDNISNFLNFQSSNGENLNNLESNVVEMASPETVGEIVTDSTQDRNTELQNPVSETTEGVPELQHDTTHSGVSSVLENLEEETVGVAQSEHCETFPVLSHSAPKITGPVLLSEKSNSQSNFTAVISKSQSSPKIMVRFPRRGMSKTRQGNAQIAAQNILHRYKRKPKKLVIKLTKEQVKSYFEKGIITSETKDNEANKKTEMNTLDKANESLIAGEVRAVSEVNSTSKQLEVDACKTSNVQSLKRHYFIRTRNGVKSIMKWKCLSCGDLEFYSKEELLEHQSKNHPRDTEQKQITVAETDPGVTITRTTKKRKDKSQKQRFQCSLCERTCSTLDGLKMHQYLHSKEMFACQYCPKNFSTPRYLKKHIQLMHCVTNTRFKCSSCDKTFKTRRTLVEHVRFIHGTKHHKCSLCEKSFRYPVLLRQHLEWHRGTPAHKCTQCDKEFFTKDSYNSHMLVHSNEKSFQCNICEKLFKHKSSLYQHKQLHVQKLDSGVVCEHCNQVFRQNKNLLAHIRSVHMQQHKHHCKICSRSFSRAGLLRDHMKTNLHAKHSKVAERNIINLEGVSNVNYNAAHGGKEFSKILPSPHFIAVERTAKENSASQKLMSIINASLLEQVKTNERTVAPVENVHLKSEISTGNFVGENMVVLGPTPMDTQPVTAPVGSQPGQTVSFLMPDGKVQELSQTENATRYDNDGTINTGIAVNQAELTDVVSSEMKPSVTMVTSLPKPGGVMQHPLFQIKGEDHCETNQILETDNIPQPSEMLISHDSTQPDQPQVIPVTPGRQDNEGSKFTVDLSDWSVLSSMMKTPDGKLTILPNISGFKTPVSPTIKIVTPQQGKATKIKQLLAQADASKAESLALQAAVPNTGSVPIQMAVPNAGTIPLQTFQNTAVLNNSEYLTLRQASNVDATQTVVLQTPSSNPAKTDPIIAYQTPTGEQQIIFQSPAASVYAGDNQPIVFQTPSPGMRIVQVASQTPASNLLSSVTTDQNLDTPILK